MVGERRELPAALAAIGALAGTGFASGRELALFFGQLGRVSWLGIAAASALYGLMLAGLCRAMGATGAVTVPQLLHRVAGRRAGRAAGLLRGVLLTGVALVMGLRAWRVGELTLPLRHGGLWGVALALALALGVAGLDGLPWAGGATLLAAVAFYGALALDPRPARVYARAEVRLALEGSRTAALLQAVPYAALNAAVSGGAALRRCGGTRPGRLGLWAGGLLAAALCCANAAMLRGGKQLLGQEAPVALLAGRMGIAGFWLSTGFAFLCAADTLAAVAREALARGHDG